MARDPYNPVENVRRLQRRHKENPVIAPEFDMSKHAARNDLSQVNTYVAPPPQDTDGLSLFPKMRAAMGIPAIGAMTERLPPKPPKPSVAAAQLPPDAVPSLVAGNAPWTPAVAEQLKNPGAFAGPPRAAPAAAAAIPEAPESPATMTNAYGVPMAFSEQNGVPTFTDSAFDPLHYGVNASSPMSPQYRKFAEENPEAAKRFQSDTAAGMKRREGRIAQEETAAHRKALEQAAPGTALEQPYRMAMAEAALNQSDAALIAARKSDAPKGKQQDGTKVYDRLLAFNKDRFPDDPVAAQNAAISGVIQAAMNGEIPLDDPVLLSSYEQYKRALAQAMDNPGVNIPSLFSGQHAAPWNNENVTEYIDPETGQPRELPPVSSYNFGGSPNWDAVTDPRILASGGAAPFVALGAGINALRGKYAGLERRDGDGGVARRAAVNAADFPTAQQQEWLAFEAMLKQMQGGGQRPVKDAAYFEENNM